MPVIAGEYFFLHERHRAHRPAGHERDDALAYFASLGASAFVKPLTGSRGDFAQAIHGEAALDSYLDEVAKYYDAVLIQPIVEGAEYRIFLLDDDALFCARKHPPFVRGDGVRTLRELLSPITTRFARAAFRRSRPATAIPRSMPCRRKASAGDSRTDESERGRNDGAGATAFRKKPWRWHARPAARSGFGLRPSICSPVSAAIRRP